MVSGNTPVSGEVVFGWSSWRYVVAAAAISFVATAVVRLASLLSSDRAGGPGNLVTARDAALVPICAISIAIFSLLFSRARPAWLRFGDGWVELAAERRDVVVVPYQAVTSARVRWVWPVAMLDVFVDSADESRLMGLDRGGRRPFRKREGDLLRFSMPIAGLRSSAAGIRSELRRRGLSE
ncbi:hypothetical protein [Actinoplanes derwentensis]|uniref:PH domain-containing protein n=1 Tax=Actinoplanes derwentensis TaxID=113562 RepID=A0A1H1VH40_9ACTN|nr:hypothetical protein [Actinoplanes derwentensis]GID83694.1 hypothetical protein Ade03nite_26180 [Actinoplanes derwentensis]SDS84168.1 hypothetical protein SAMN04489716_1762 [Actinoplanes derwentensis]